MINLKCAEMLVGLITFLIAYLFAISIAGAFKAWVAKKMGDPTAQEAGFLTLNPIVHIDPIGLITLVFSYFGWSRFVPINPYNIDGRCTLLGIQNGFRIPKLIFAYLADTIAYFILALISLVILVSVFGVQILFTAHTMLIFSYHCMSHLFLAHAFPDYSSLMIAIGFILVALSYLSIAVGVLDLIVNASRLGIQLVSERSPERLANGGYFAILAPMLLIWFFATPLRFFATNMMVWAGGVLARIVGVI